MANLNGYMINGPVESDNDWEVADIAVDVETRDLDGVEQFRGVTRVTLVRRVENVQGNITLDPSTRKLVSGVNIQTLKQVSQLPISSFNGSDRRVIRNATGASLGPWKITHTGFSPVDAIGSRFFRLEVEFVATTTGGPDGDGWFDVERSTD